MRRRARAAERGFTLVELMTVVVIMGVLATIAFGSLSAHVSAARGAEALNMVQSIRAAEERWRTEHMMYLNVSTDQEWYPRDPTKEEARNHEQAFYYEPDDDTHEDAGRWLLLRPTAPDKVRFGYLVHAGTAGNAMTTPARGPDPGWPAAAANNWYVIEAIGDADWDGKVSYYRASSLDDGVFSIDHGE